MDNMGGLNRLYYIDAGDVTSLELDENNVFDLTLTGGKAPVEISFTQDTGKVSESEEDTDDGVVYNFEASCQIPGCSESNNDLFGEYRHKKLLILWQDNNVRLRLTGYPGSYFDIKILSDTGTGSQEYNGRMIKITAALAKASVFINPIT
jgi:hypothetical protein